MSIQKVKDVVGLGIGVAKLVEEAADGITLGEVMGMVGLLKKVKPAIDAVKDGQALVQYLALDDAGKQELSQWFDSELDMKDDKVEQVVEQSFKVALELNELVKLIKPGAV